MLYVSTNGAHQAPFDNWDQAATDIQSAVDLASEGDTVVVGDGEYVLSSTITITQGITVCSLNGPTHTAVNGNQACQCVDISHSNCVFDGFTITGGILTESGTCGAGVAIKDGVLRDCIVSNNYASFSLEPPLPPPFQYGADGGAIACFGTPRIENSVIIHNRAVSNGGGIFSVFSGVVIRNVVLAYNEAGESGGGAWFYSEGLISRERRPHLENVTICGNKAGGGIRVVGYARVSLTNSIVWGNSPVELTDGMVPMETSHCDIRGGLGGEGNIDADPMFVLSNDWHITASSPCRNAGTNLSWMSGALDVDGQPRIFDERVDMGADEAVMACAGISTRGGVDMVWDVVVGAVCQLQWSTNPASGRWDDVDNVITAQQATVTIRDSGAPAFGRVFYRMKWVCP